MLFTMRKVKYKGVLDLKEVDIPAKQVFCIRGESGGGKTTFLRLLNRMISPEEGSVSYQGVDLSAMSPISLRREVLMLPQNPIVFSGTIRENLQIGLVFSERPVVGDEELRQVMKDLYLEQELDCDTANLSGGEQQRLALGRLLLMKPEVLLLDEPSSALDLGLEEKILEYVVSTQRKRGKSLIMVTHSKSLLAHGDSCIELAQGKVVGR